MIEIRIRDEDVGIGWDQGRVQRQDRRECRDSMLESDKRYEDQDKGVEIRYKEQKMKLDMCRRIDRICVDQCLSKELLMISVIKMER